MKSSISLYIIMVNYVDFWRKIQELKPSWLHVVFCMKYQTFYCCSVAKSYPILCASMDCRTQAFLSFTISWSLLKLMSIESVTSSSCLLLCHSLLLCLQSFTASGDFSKESVLHIRWPKYWSFSINPPNEYSGLIFIGIDWSDLLAVQGTLESSPTPQLRSINSLVFRSFYSPIFTSIHDSWKNHSFD